MWGQAIDSAVGLTFVFAATALFCSALVEGYATLTERRARYLITALRNMLDAPEGDTTGARPKLSPDAIYDAAKQPTTTAKAAQNLRRVEAIGMAAPAQPAPDDAGRPDPPEAQAAAGAPVPPPGEAPVPPPGDASAPPPGE